MVATTINYLSCKSGEQCLRPFCAINHVELAFGLRADDALFVVAVASKNKTFPNVVDSCDVLLIVSRPEDA